jgi:hypothetical protein
MRAGEAIEANGPELDLDGHAVSLMITGQSSQQQ